MNAGYKEWMENITKLRSSIQTLKSTDNVKILEHFFTQALESEFSLESTKFKTTLKQLLSAAVGHISNTTPSQSAAFILKKVTNASFPKFRLTDIRNYAVFNLYMRCGVTVDTYFERFSSPPGNSIENELYLKVAHGHSVCNAEETSILADLLTYMQFLKRVFVVKQMLRETGNTVFKPSQLNWIGFMMLETVQELNFSMLIWNLFVDIYNYQSFL